MQIVITSYLDESMSLMRDSTKLVDLYQEKNAEFVPSLVEWLRKSEDLLKRYNRNQLGAMSALRGKALAAQTGILSRGEITVRRLQARKQIAGACVLILSEGQSMLQDIHSTLEAKREEALHLIQQMLHILMQSGILSALLDAGTSPEERLNLVWKSCQSTTEVATGARQVLGLISWADALRLIDETLDSWRI